MQDTTNTRIPICLVTGFLGSGKTTFLKHIVSQYHTKKLVYLVNEFSPHDIDGAIVSKTNPNVVSIAGGSIFCKCLVTEFIHQLTTIPSAYDGVEGIVIEASGMANPKMMEEMLQETRLDDRYHLANIVSIVDPGSFMKLRVTLPNIITQIEASDTILINKSDLYDADTISETLAAVAAINATATIHFCKHAAVDIELFTPHTTPRNLHGEYAKCKDPNYESVTISLGRPISMDTFKTLLLNAKTDIFRVKGDIPTPSGSHHVEYSKSGLTTTETATVSNHTLVIILRGTSSADAQTFITWLNAQTG